MKHFKKILLCSLALCLAIGTACFAAACGGGQKNIQYTVSVSCEDGDALEEVEVSLKTEGGAAVENGGPKALTDGKASFSLPSATYRVALSNVPEGYQWDPAWVSEERPNATVTLYPAVQKAEYAVTAVDEEGSPVAGVLFSLTDAEGKKAASAQTGADGKALLKAPLGSYTLCVDLTPEGYLAETFDGTMSANALSKTLTFTAFEPLSELPAPFRGSWHDLEGRVALLINSGALLYNGEPLGAYAGQDGEILFWAGDTAAHLKPYEKLGGTLLLEQDGRSTPLLPDDGLPYISVPAYLGGTWTISDEEGNAIHTLLFEGSTFTLEGTDGFVASYLDGGETESIVGIIETGDLAGIYFITYVKGTGGLEVPGFDLPFFKSGAGTSADPEVITDLAQEFSCQLIATSRDVGGFMQQWSYSTAYFTYTAGGEDETYTLIANDYDLLFTLTKTDAAEDDLSAVLINWDVNSATSNYVPFTLEAGTQYTITVTSGRTSSRRLDPCVMTFKVEAGAKEAPAPRIVPAHFHGIWYNKADDNDRITIMSGAHPAWESDVLLWGGDAMELISAQGDVLTVKRGEAVWTFTRDGATLTGQCGGESAVFSLLSSNPHSAPIPSAYGGLWMCDGSRSPSGKTEYIYIVPLTYEGVGDEAEIVDDGAFYWMGRAAVVTDASLLGLTIVMDDEVYSGSYNYATGLTVSKEDGSESYVFTAPSQSQYVNDFSAIEGTWTAQGYTITAEKDGFVFNGTTLSGLDEGHPDEEGKPTEVASKVVLLEGKLTFCVEGRFYTLETNGDGLLLTLLNTGETFPLTLSA